VEVAEEDLEVDQVAVLVLLRTLAWAEVDVEVPVLLEVVVLLWEGQAEEVRLVVEEDLEVVLVVVDAMSVQCPAVAPEPAGQEAWEVSLEEEQASISTKDHPLRSVVAPFLPRFKTTEDAIVPPRRPPLVNPPNPREWQLARVKEEVLRFALCATMACMVAT